MKLLTVGNPKTAKGRAKGYLTSILHLAPSRMSGYQTCPMATAGCAASCLNTAGRGGMFAGEKTANLTGAEMVEAIKSGRLHNRIQSARITRTRMFFERRDEFMEQLYKEIQNTIKRANRLGLTPVFRLNGTSDIRWETVDFHIDSDEFPGGFHFANIMEAFPGVQFYDYTKLPNRRKLPKNYHLTFSLAESNDAQAVQAFNNGMNVAVVFRTADLPDSYLFGDFGPDVIVGPDVINGDADDLRFLDPKNVIVGLKAKGKAKKDTSGFVRL